MLILDLIILLLLFVIVYYIYKPIPARNLYRKYNPPITNHDKTFPNQINIITYKNKPFRRLHINPRQQNTNTILIWFHGGSFIQEKYDNMEAFLILTSKTLNINILTFDYPLLYLANLSDTLVFIHKLLYEFFLENTHYTNIFYAGDSAGTYLALKTIEIEYNQALRKELQIPPEITLQLPNAFIGICGFYDGTMDNKPFVSFLVNLWLWNVKNMNNYKNTNLIIPALIITSSRDFLSSQSIRFIRNQSPELIESHIFETPNTLHCFISNVTLPETKKTVQLIGDFLLRHS